MDIGKSHIELIQCHFDPVASLYGSSEPTIPRREYQIGEIIG